MDRALRARCEPLPINVSADLQERIIDFLYWHEVAALRQLALEFYEFAETLNAEAKSVHFPWQLYSRATTVPFYHLKNGYRVVTDSLGQVLLREATAMTLLQGDICSLSVWRLEESRIALL